MHSKNVFLAAAAAILCVHFSYAADYEKILRHQFPLENASKIVVEADTGDVQLIPSETGIITVDVLMNVSANNQNTADRAFDKILAEFLQPKDGQARVNVRSNRTGISWLQFWKKYPDVKVRIHVPDDIELVVATGAGDVAGTGLSANAKIATGAGDVELDRFHGSINIATGAGDIQLVKFHGTVSAATGAGDFAADGNLQEFSVSTGKGDVQLLVDNPVSANSSVSTGMGDITVGLPVGSSFELLADVGFGDISTDFDIVDTDPEEKSFRGTYNEGSVKLRFSTGFGDFRLFRR